MRASLAYLDRRGKLQTLPAEAWNYVYPRFSPDDKRIAVQINGDGASNIWIYDIENNLLSQLTFDGGAVPLWSPDGKEVTFLKENALWTVPVDRSRPATLLPGTAAAGNVGPGSWSTDGKVLLFSSNAGIQAWDRSNTGKTASIIIPRRGEESPRNPDFSSDGRWFVYVMVGTARSTPDLYVSPYPSMAGSIQRITTTGGLFPVWVRNQHEIILVSQNPIAPGSRGRGAAFESSVLALSITTEPTLTRRNPGDLFRLSGINFGARGGRNYDVSRDGERFIVIQTPLAGVSTPGAQPAAADALRIHVVRNWFEEIEQRVPK
jgi:dipeptidyl aminopeptidase/acylaminoacyl peptidase